MTASPTKMISRSTKLAARDINPNCIDRCSFRGAAEEEIDDQILFYYSMVLLLRQFLIPCVSAKFEPFDDAVCWLNHRTFCFLSALPEFAS